MSNGKIIFSDEEMGGKLPDIQTMINGLPELIKKIPGLPQPPPNSQMNIDQLINMATEFIKTNPTIVGPDIIKQGPDGIEKILTGMVNSNKVSAEVLPYVKSAIEVLSKGQVDFSNIPGNNPTQGNTVQSGTPIKLGVKNDKIVQIQTKLNEKYKAGLKVDGLWGPKTANAVMKYLPQLKQPEVKPQVNPPIQKKDDDTLV
jgi:hypothetical protein